MFIDDVLKQNPDMPEPRGIFKIQNVADYYYLTPTQDNFKYAEDVFSFRLPFNPCWFEYNQRDFELTTGIKKNIFKGCRTGIYAFEKPVENDGVVVEFCVFMKLDNDIACLGVEDVLCDKLGKFPHLNAEIIWPSVSKGNYLFRINNLIQQKLKVNAEFTRALMGVSTIPVALTLNFLQCKNVDRKEEVFSKAFLRARKKRSKPYFEKFYTLAIDPMKKILNEKGQAQSRGLKYAFHICRGHFSTYTQKKPLFGKFVGTVWVPAHTRGSQEIGRIGKNYEVGPIAV